MEFGAYLLATALGLNLIITPAAGGAFKGAVTRLIVLYPVVVVALALAAWLEVKELRSRIPTGLQLPKDLNIEELRAKALEMMKRRPGWRHDWRMEPTRDGSKKRAAYSRTLGSAID